MKGSSGGAALTGDRDGFELTEANSHHKYIHEDGEAIPRLNVAEYNDYDLCVVFPKEAKKGTKLLDRTQVLEKLELICRARIGNDINELNNQVKFHPVYGNQLEKTVGSMTQQAFNDLCLKLFLRVLKHIGASWRIESGRDKDENKFVSIRLGEEGCKVIADYLHYPLQVCRDVTSYREFRNDSNYYAPYLAYEPSIEAKNGRLIWTRYDRFSRAVRVSESNATSVLTSGELSLFRDVDRARLLRSGIFEFINLDQMCEEKLVVSYYNIKQPAVEKCLRVSWANWKKLFSFSQPLNDIRNYYGEEIALYYAWMGYYCRMSVIPAVVGLAVGGLGVAYNRKMNFQNPYVNMSRLVYCVFMGFWNVIFFAFWQRRERLLMLQWNGIASTGSNGVKSDSGNGLEREENPFFRPSAFVSDPAKPDHFVRWFSPRQRWVRMALTSIVLFVSVAGLTLFVNEDLLDAIARITQKNIDEDGYMGLEGWVKYTLPNEKMMEYASLVVLATTLMLKAYNMIFKQFIVKGLAKFENHQYIDDYSQSVDLKLFVLRIVGYFTVLFYLAFFKEYYNPCEETTDGRCLPRLSKQLLNFYFIDLVMIASEIGVPLAKYVLKLFTKKPVTGLPEYQREFYLAEYTGNSGISGEYMEKIVQYAYTGLFSMACPFLPFVGLVVNMIELRSDAYKLATVYRRPYPRNAAGLGLWDEIQKSMSFLGILSNVMLCMFATVGHGNTMTQKLSGSLCLLLIGVALKDLIEYKLPAENSAYTLLRARMQLTQHEALWGDKPRIPVDPALLPKPANEAP